jgi:two-component system sensor histidine kinase DesK
VAVDMTDTAVTPKEADPPGGWPTLRRALFEPTQGRDPVGRKLGIRRWRVTSGIWLVYLLYPLDSLARQADAAHVVLAIVLMAAFCYLYVVPLPRAMFTSPSRQRLEVLVGMPVLLAIYLAVVGQGGLVLVIYWSVALAVLLVPGISLPIILVIAAATTWLPQYVPSWHVRGPMWDTTTPFLLVVFVVYVVRAFTRGQIELYQAQAEIERLAQEQERLRISRDLHDLLGHALTTITVKAELASRLAARDPARAAAEMAEVAALSRESLADVRATVAGYRNVSLVTELAAAREVLDAAGIVAELPAAVEDVPAPLRELFGWVLREGVTNAVRHSGARAVRVVVTGESIEIIDDGTGPESVGPPAGPGPRRPTGAGLAGLAERMTAAGGRLETGPGASGRGFRLRAVVPAV